MDKGVRLVFTYCCYMVVIYLMFWAFDIICNSCVESMYKTGLVERSEEIQSEDSSNTELEKVSEVELVESESNSSGVDSIKNEKSDEVESIESEPISDDIESTEESELSINLIKFLAVFCIVFLITGLLIAVLVNKYCDLRNGDKIFRKPYNKISKFCLDNKIVLSTDVMFRLSNESKTSDLYRTFVCDLVRCKNFSKLLVDSTSPKWLVFFFYLAPTGFVVIEEDDLHSIAINYFNDVVDYYNKLKSISVTDALDKLNQSLMKNLTLEDIRSITDIVENDDFKVNKDLRISLILSDDVNLELKYLSSSSKCNEVLKRFCKIS